MKLGHAIVVIMMQVKVGGDDDAGEDDDIFNVIYHLNNIRAPVMIYSRKVKQMPKVVRKTEPVHCTHLKIIIVI